MAAPVWLIAGPTASGKSSLALALADAVGGEIVNADSMQVYRDLKVLTARPSPADLDRAPHHLYGIADGAEAWSVGHWRRAVQTVLEGIAGRGRTAIVVGGTGLYFRALTEGLSEIPPVPAALRDTVEQAYALEGEMAFRARLSAVDPAAEARIAAGDRQRLVRALSVHQATGRALSDWRSDGADGALPAWRGLVLDPPRETLYARCDRRLEAMAGGGAFAEVEALMARRLDPGLPVMKALGVPEFMAHLAGTLSRAEAVATAQQATRRYAKRQTTWFRNQTADWPRLPAADLTAALAALSQMT